MEINPEAELDTSAVEDIRGTSGGGGPLGGRVAVGGGGVSIVGLLIYFLLSQLGGGSVDLGGLGGLAGGPSEIGGAPSSSQGQSERDEALRQRCASGRDASANSDCEAVALVNSIEAFWKDALARSGTPYRPAVTNLFDGPINTGGCGQATPDVGPFSCPADGEVYIDLSFYQELESRFGARGGLFARAYVMAHEYGHHVQNLLGTSDRVRRGSGPASDSVRLELQADCYAGAWANHATRTTTASGRPLITDITRDDIEAGLDTAARIGDDFIQSNLGGGSVDESQFSHGSSAQRQKWLIKGLSSGNPADCDTFARGVDLG
ncbi:MAG: KPN_02809 family neutral zinc metallopeptidase [Pseudonocardia sp.]